MADATEHKRSPEGWLEVEGETGKPHTVYCPRQEKDTPLIQCLMCKRYRSLAIDPSGQTIYLDCNHSGPDEPATAPGA
jgi:hypothetical protein